MRERKRIRLKSYDYSQDGYYFVTICAENREEWFGKVEKEEMILNQYGKIVNQCWDDLPNHYLNCSLDTFVIMPNHIQGIIVIHNDNTVGNGLKPFPTHGLSEMIRGFKTFSSRKINGEIKSDNKFQWQKSFYDHVIRNEKSLHNLRHYITFNSLKWELDIENRGNVRVHSPQEGCRDYYKKIIDDKWGTVSNRSLQRS
jgi:REP element-mobilizing transposase RayT